MSANFFNGYSGDKPSSKVLNPPGGRSNNIFGGYDENSGAVATNKAKNQTSSIFFGDDSTPENHMSAKHQQHPNQPITAANNNNIRNKSSVFGDDTPKEATHGDHTNHSAPAAKNVKYNPITGKEEIEAPKREDAPKNPSQEEEKGSSKPIHTSSRVLQPPGGKSSGLW